MRHDAIEQRLAARKARRRSGRSTRRDHLRTSRTEPSCGPNVKIIDEAFAAFTRVDAPVAPVKVQADERQRGVGASLADHLLVN
jgi:hypothetical protein